MEEERRKMKEEMKKQTDEGNTVRHDDHNTVFNCAVLRFSQWFSEHPRPLGINATLMGLLEREDGGTAIF
jgi:hypothetical protein